jgi:tripartite motif-containing protein 2/3
MSLIRFRTRPEQARRRGPLFLYALLVVALCLASRPGPAHASHRSDQNKDGVVDLQDVIQFAEEDLGQDWQSVDWCQWLQTENKKHQHMEELLAFIEAYFQCDRLAVVNANVYPTRLAWGADGKLYVSDALVGSVFIYERLTELTLVGELKRIAKPLGVAVGAGGTLYIGADDSDRVEVYDAQGAAIGTIGESEIEMPNDLALGPSGTLYVADSQARQVWVYGANGTLLRSIGAGQLRFPVALEVFAEELYVADQASFEIKVFDLEGTPLRTLGGPATQGMLGYKWKGRFVRLQSLAIDASGRLHALDSHQGLIEILDRATGSYISSHGEKGTGTGQLQLPLDIVLLGSGETAVTDAENKRVEILPTP